MRKIYFLFILFSLAAFTVQAATYYSKTSGNANQLTTWGINTDGTGATPTNFTTNGDIFILRLASTLGTNGNWVVGAGVTLQIDGLLNVNGNNDDVTINGTVFFTSSNTANVNLQGAGSGNSFIVASGAVLKTKNVNGIQGTNCSLPANASKKTVTLNANATYQFVGTANQATTGLPATITNVVINNPAGVTVSAPVTITGTLTLTQGVVSTTAVNLVTISSTGTVSGASDASFVNGPVAKTGATAFTFPVGNTTGSNPNRYHPISIGIPSASTTFVAEYIRAGAGLLDPDVNTGIYGISACEYWGLARTGASATADVTLSWNDYSGCSANYINTTIGLIVAWRNPTTSRWENSIGTSQSVSSASPYNTGTLTRATVNANGFGYFTFGNVSENGSPLPVKLGNITAFEKQTGIQINWTAYQEDQLEGYQVERSLDGQHFSFIGTVTAKNQAYQTNYNFFDPVPVQGINFYRLRVVDIDGKFDYSNVIKVNLYKKDKAITLYPNPAKNGYIAIETAELAAATYAIRIFNAAGQQILKQSFVHNGGAISKTIQLPTGTKAGIYLLQMESNGTGRLNKRFVVQ